jgi:hypothetical protein
VGDADDEGREMLARLGTTMLFGSRDEFAIECHERPMWGDGLVRGGVCVWCRGVGLGRLKEPCILTALQCHLERLLWDLHTRSDPAVEDKGDEEAFRLLSWASYGLDECIEVGGRRFGPADQRRLGRFVFLTNSLEAFDGWSAFLLVSGEDARILYRLPTDERGGARVPVARFTEVVRAFLAWVEDLSTRTTGDPAGS